MKDVEVRIAAVEEAVGRGRANEAGYLMKVCAKYEIDKQTLIRWMAKVKNIPRPQWEDALRPSFKGRQPTDIQPEAWEYFVERYRQSGSISAAHQAYVDRALSENWPALSRAILRRRLVHGGLLIPRHRSLPEFDISLDSHT